MSLYFESLEKYATFAGRASRKEYWSFTLINLLIMCFCGVLVDAADQAVVLFGYLVWLFLILPSLAVTSRRLHDSNLSGWWMLLCLIPVIGGLIFLYFALRDSSIGTNKYGKNPKGIGNNSASNSDRPTGDNSHKGTLVGKLIQKTTKKALQGSSQRTNEDTTYGNELYEQVWKEIEENRINLGLWAKCFSTCEGVENKTKALYINERLLILKENSTEK